MIRSNYNHRARLVLGEPQAVYYAGQELTGYIELDIQQPIQFSAINVTFHGEARTHWIETDIEEYNGIQRRREVPYNGGQECLHYTQCLYGMVLPGRGEGIVDLTSLPPGQREIPFKFILPRDIPSSFKSELGRITYSVTAYVDYLDHSAGRDELYHEFDVVAPMNLLEDDIVSPLEMNFEEVYSCWCTSSPMNIDIKSPVSGYCPGQAIPINIKVKNRSAVEVKKIVLQLVKKVLYRSQDPPSENTTPDEVLSTIKTGAILSNSDKGLMCHLPVPPMIAPNMDNCDIIDVGFFLRATIKMTGCNDDLEDEVLLFIGLKPIPGTPGSENYVHPLACNLPNGSPVTDSPLRANVERVDPPNSDPYLGHGAPPYPADNMNSRPIQPLSSPYPCQNAPYPTESSRSHIPSHHMSYPGQIAPPYPTHNAVPNSSGPESNLPPKIMGDAPPYPVPTDYPSPTPPNPSRSTSPYPPPKPMSDAPPYPVPTDYPSPTPPNPSWSTSPYPPPKPMSDAPPYPVSTDYPSPTPPNPSRSTSPYPPQSSPNPTQNPPYPLANSPYPPSNSTHAKTESMSMTPLRTQNLGFIVARGFPYPTNKNDDRNSPYTPPMQSYSPSAPPPSS